MRIRDGFQPGAIPGFTELLSPAPASSISSNTVPETPDSFRRFLFMDEPDHAGAGPDSMVIVGAGTRLETLATLAHHRVGLVLAEASLAQNIDSIQTPVLRIRDARITLATLLHALAERIEHDVPFAAGTGNLIHPTAVVEGVLEGNVSVEAGVVVEKGSYVGFGTRLEANSVVRAHTVIGRDCVVQSGVVLGCAGFGFFGTPAGLEHMPHHAGVRIGARCFLGANTVVAAGVLHPTEIGDDGKLDSHVQIAHNVRLGAGALLASQSGIAGSTVIGKNFRMGGAASVAGHLRLGDGVSVAAKAGVTKDVADGGTVAGFPARPIAEWRRVQAAQARSGKDVGR